MIILETISSKFEAMLIRVKVQAEQLSKDLKESQAASELRLKELKRIFYN
jgi:hypothetical protein